MPDDIEDLLKKFDEISGDLTKALDDAVGVTALRVLSSAAQSMREPSQGQAYKRGEKTHIASAEGDAPNVDTGDLIRSIRVEHKRGSGVAAVGTSIDYGAILELLKGRPWLKPALDSEESDFYKNAAFVIETQIAKAAE
jgi:hypothetical protein